jgi:uncharacterized protein (TIGR02145 family)
MKRALSGNIFFIPALLILIFIACSRQDTPGSNSDIVKAGVYEWSARNLDVTTFLNGDTIPEAATDEEWERASIEGTPAWCYYNNDPGLGEKYGKLYNWYALNDPRRICPEGWHIPSNEEWDRLVDFIGDKAGNRLKSTEGWHKNGNGSDDIGFSVFPGGIRYPGGVFDGLEGYAYFWTTDNNNNVWHRYFEYMSSDVETRKYHSLKKGTGMSARCVRRTLYDGYSVNPPEPPNEGILFVDHESKRRSGHYGAALTECKNGDILAFYMNVSGEIYDGHSQAGWTEYKRSEDGGKTWGEPVKFEYSKKVWEDNNLTGDSIPHGAHYYSAYVATAITAPNGNIVTVLTRRKATEYGIIGQLPPVYIISKDNGNTWSEPKEVDKDASIEELSMTHSDGASFVYDGVIYIGFIGGNFGDGKYSFYASEDNGETFTKRSEGLFENRPYKKNYYYMTAKALDDGSFIVYSYNPDDDQNLPYVISKDRGYTWSEVRTTFLEKRIRSGQMSEKIGDYYFMQGRSGRHDSDVPWSLVLYASKDGINWDRGIYLNKVQLGLDSYSANEVVGKYNSSTPKKLLIQSSVSYSGYGRVNLKHWWVENIPASK